MTKKVLLLDDPEVVTLVREALAGEDVLLVPGIGAITEGTEKSIRLAVEAVKPDLIVVEPFCFRWLDLPQILGRLGIPYAIMTTMTWTVHGRPRWITGRCSGFTDSNTTWNRVLEKPSALDEIRAFFRRLLEATAQGEKCSS